MESLGHNELNNDTMDKTLFEKKIATQQFLKDDMATQFLRKPMFAFSVISWHWWCRLLESFLLEGKELFTLCIDNSIAADELAVEETRPAVAVVLFYSCGPFY